MSVPVYATSPLPWAVAGAIVLAVLWRHLPLWLAIAGIIVEVLLVAVMTPLGADLLARTVAARAPPATACTAPAPTTIVVLAGGFEHSPDGTSDYGALRQVSLQRLFAGVALWHQTPSARLVLSGGGGRVPESVVMANLAMQLGVPSNAITVEDRSHSTWENAQYVAALMPPLPRRIRLVTSPMHLPRALVAFRAWGFSPCGWPASPRQAIPALSLSLVIPQGTAVRKAAYALHELIGGAEYMVMARQHTRQAASSRPP